MYAPIRIAFALQAVGIRVDVYFQPERSRSLLGVRIEYARKLAPEPSLASYLDFG